MPKPVIGITADYNDTRPAYHMNFHYCDAVNAAGGIALILPYRSNVADIPQILPMLDGIIFSGGHDLNPSAWGETVHPKATTLDPDREQYERALFTAVEARRLPTLGICLGSQLLNVHRGGTLRQFIPDEPAPHGFTRIEHRKTSDQETRHPITVATDSLLAQTVGGTEILANSSHKQAYGQIGKGLRVVATAPDGIPEALEDPSFPLMLGVQWHPERIHTEPPHRRIFELLVRRSAEFRK